MSSAQRPERRRIVVSGVVQGVGFRPFVHGLATRAGLSGFVGNDSGSVFVEVEGPAAALDVFAQALHSEAPPLAHVEAVEVAALEPTGETQFRIVESEQRAGPRTFVSPDVATCDDCLRELFDPADRRHRHPFVNCTNCGPRFTIVRTLPYDRPNTTMAGFAMCDACRAEYEDPGDRRFHAQPIACPACGPQVALDGRSGDAAIVEARRLLAGGAVVAVKGIGGYHLACDAADDAVLGRLRERKGRVEKPFAVMVAGLDAARGLAHVSDDEAALLSSPARPIVLLRQRAGAPLSPLVNPGNPCVGLLLPYSPLHHLLLEGGSALVLTSGNRSDEPIAYDDADARERLAPLADAFLVHDRPIHVPCDDSVVRVHEGAELPLRRSRGYAPLPVRLPHATRPVLAVGGELKSTFALASGGHAFLSQHLGDMESLETLEAFERALGHLSALLAVEPETVAHDAHPGYATTRWAGRTAGPRPLLAVQHHHAHVASAMAEHGLDGSAPVLGIAFDGTGYGSDGTIWGGEALVADYAGFRRAGHLAPVPLPGGDAAIRRPYRVALAHLFAAGLAWEDGLAPVEAAGEDERRLLRRQLETGFNTVPTTSMGRLFDAVASLAGVRQEVSYEGQAAMELEALAGEPGGEAYRFALGDGDPLVADPAPVIRAVARDVRAGAGAAAVSARFHLAVADLVLAFAQREGLETVALTGGVFQNVLLLELACDRLRGAGFRVLTHRLVPPNDGGLALGQAAVAAAARHTSGG